MEFVKVNPKTALLADIEDTMGREQCGWGWTHWDGPNDADALLYVVFRCQERQSDGTLKRYYEIEIAGEPHHILEHGDNFRRFALESGWLPVISYIPEGDVVGIVGRYGPADKKA